MCFSSSASSSCILIFFFLLFYYIFLLCYDDERVFYYELMMIIIIVQWINDKKVCMLNTDAEVTTYLRLHSTFMPAIKVVLLNYLMHQLSR